jgi:hypothetical protein
MGMLTLAAHHHQQTAGCTRRDCHPPSFFASFVFWGTLQQFSGLLLHREGVVLFLLSHLGLLKYGMSTLVMQCQQKVVQDANLLLVTAKHQVAEILLDYSTRIFGQST